VTATKMTGWLSRSSRCARKEKITAYGKAQGVTELKELTDEYN